MLPLTLYNGEDCGIAYGLLLCDMHVMREAQHLLSGDTISLIIKLVAGRMQSRCGDYWWGVSGVK